MFSTNCTSLKNIYAINPIPAVIESNTFPTRAIQSGNMYVPEGSTSIYWIHPYWGKFRNLASWNSGSEENFVIDDVTYHVTSVADATVEITAATLNGRSRADEVTLTIPATVEFKNVTYRVTGVANNGFEDSAITSLILPETISYVGLEAFKGCTALGSITCNAMLPPSANNNSFDQNTYAKATLRVPESAVDSYNQHAVWQLFTISGEPLSEITDVVEGEEADGPFDIYNMRGMLIKRDAVADDLKDLSPDIYIIRQGACVRKIVVR